MLALLEVQGGGEGGKKAFGVQHLAVDLVWIKASVCM